MKEKLKESNTINMHYIGYQGFSPNLSIQLIQNYGVSPAIAHRLVKAYGGRAHDVLKIALAECTKPSTPENQNKVEERLLIKGFPYLEAEVIFATRYEWTRHAEDFLAHRTRLAFLNRNAAISAIPRVVELMAKELQWDTTRQEIEVKRCLEFMRHIGGSTPLTAKASCRLAMQGDMLDAFATVDKQNRGYILPEELPLFAELMNYPISDEEMKDCVSALGLTVAFSQPRISFDHLFEWWNSDRLNPGLKELREKKMANPTDVKGSGTMFG